MQVDALMQAIDEYRQMSEAAIDYKADLDGTPVTDQIIDEWVQGPDLLPDSLADLGYNPRTGGVTGRRVA